MDDSNVECKGNKEVIHINYLRAMKVFKDSIAHIEISKPVLN